MISRVLHSVAPTPATPPTPPAASTPQAPPVSGCGHRDDDQSYLAPDVVRDRLEQGRIAEYETGKLDPAVGERGAPAYFRTYEQIKTALSQLQAKYPDLVEVIDIGDSSEKVAGTADRDVLLLRLTAKGMNDGRKPSSMHIAGEHAREIANPELVLRHASTLLEGYGTDPEATALLQTRMIDIVPMMNPDGHAVIERGYANAAGGNLMQRKNTAPPAGTDLNRNYDFRWGGGGASSSPRSDTYRGPSAASEPEVQAIQRHVTGAKPGIFIDWHSYSKLNLFPWGDTRQKAPDFDGLNAIANKFSTWNRYTPKQSVELYPTNGTSKDWVYGTHQTPAFTIETGNTFHQTDAEFAQSWAENAPVMRYADKIADAPFQRVAGPDVTDVHITATSAAPGGTRTASLRASVTDATNGATNIARAELVTDPFAAPGTGTPLVAADGVFDTPTEQVSGAVNATNGARQLVYVRAQDDQGNWGPLTAQWVADEA